MTGRIVKTEATSTIRITDETPDEIRVVLHAFGFPVVTGDCYRFTVRRFPGGIREGGRLPGRAGVLPRPYLIADLTIAEFR